MRCDKSIDNVSETTDIRLESFDLPYSRSQDRRGNAKEDLKKERAQRSLQIFSCEE